MKGPFVHPNDRLGQACGLGPNFIIIVGGNLLVPFLMHISLGIALLVIALYALNANDHTFESQTLPTIHDWYRAYMYSKTWCTRHIFECIQTLWIFLHVTSNSQIITILY